MVIDVKSAERYLAIIQEIGASVCLTDSHVHPFDVLFDLGKYQVDSSCNGLYADGRGLYTPPQIGPVSLGSPDPPPADAPIDMVKRMMMLSMRHLYAHTGPHCWNAHADMAGIGRFAMLPVSQPGNTSEARMAEMVQMFGDDPRFLLGYCLPNVLLPDQVEADVCRAVENYGIRVLKVHPTLSGHILTETEGRDRLNALLHASRSARLPVVLHGGPSLNMGDLMASVQGELENLAQLELGATDQPVVIAHAGAFGLDAEETRLRILPKLQGLLSRHDHLLVDTSALPAETLGQVLEEVDASRIVFGSDALYEPPWKAAVKLYWILEQKFSRPEQLFAQIAGENPEKLFGKEA